jgi:hypothetical protein
MSEVLPTLRGARSRMWSVSEAVQDASELAFPIEEILTFDGISDDVVDHGEPLLRGGRGTTDPS